MPAVVNPLDIISAHETVVLGARGASTQCSVKYEFTGDLVPQHCNEDLYRWIDRGYKIRSTYHDAGFIYYVLDR